MPACIPHDYTRSAGDSTNAGQGNACFNCDPVKTVSLRRRCGEAKLVHIATGKNRATHLRGVIAR
jgi:hypothetical protein